MVRLCRHTYIYERVYILPVDNTPGSLVIWRLESRPSETDEDRDGMDSVGRTLGFLWNDAQSENKCQKTTKDPELTVTEPRLKFEIRSTVVRLPVPWAMKRSGGKGSLR